MPTSLPASLRCVRYAEENEDDDDDEMVADLRWWCCALVAFGSPASPFGVVVSLMLLFACPRFEVLLLHVS